MKIAAILGPKSIEKLSLECEKPQNFRLRRAKTKNRNKKNIDKRYYMDKIAAVGGEKIVRGVGGDPFVTSRVGALNYQWSANRSVIRRMPGRNFSNPPTGQ